MREAREADRASDRLDRQRRRRARNVGRPTAAGEVTFPPGSPMSPVEEHTVEYSLPMTKDDLFGLLGTYSGVITLDPAKRADFSQRARDFLDRQPWEQTDLPMICRCLRSTRLPGRRPRIGHPSGLARPHEAAPQAGQLVPRPAPRPMNAKEEQHLPAMSKANPWAKAAAGCRLPWPPPGGYNKGTTGRLRDNK